jgi:hypothetical protein
MSCGHDREGERAMILRRLSQSLKEQNWTAIAIEFVLLVLGVFLGIQVSNWNAERETREKAAVFTARLKDDLRMEAWRYQFSGERIQVKEQAANEALILLADYLRGTDLEHINGTN